MKAGELETMGVAFQSAAVVLAANRCGVLAALSGASATPAELAERLDLDPRAVTTVCQALVSLGVAAADGERLTIAPDLRPLLDPDSPTGVAHILDHQWHLFQRWGRLDDVLRTGEPIPRAAGDEAARRAFILGMADLARGGSREVWEHIDLAGRNRLVDVGGGPGEYAIAALERYPALRATVFDLPPVLAIAREYAAPRGVLDRMSFHPGDALADPVPACDAALVFSLVHSYGEAEVERVAANVAAGLERGGLLVIREFLWDSPRHDGPLSTALFAVNMLVGTATGRCWAAEELEAIFAPHGFARWRQVKLDPRAAYLLAERT